MTVSKISVVLHSMQTYNGLKIKWKELLKNVNLEGQKTTFNTGHRNSRKVSPTWRWCQKEQIGRQVQVQVASSRFRCKGYTMRWQRNEERDKRKRGACRSAGIESALSSCNNRSLFVRSAASCLPVVINRQICRVPYDYLSSHTRYYARKGLRRLAIPNRCCITLRSYYHEQIREMLNIISEIRRCQNQIIFRIIYVLATTNYSV